MSQFQFQSRCWTAAAVAAALACAWRFPCLPMLANAVGWMFGYLGSVGIKRLMITSCIGTISVKCLKVDESERGCESVMRGCSFPGVRSCILVPCPD
ncbi:hypothetical protein QBC45DRAFT_410683 [Copromyces sp. CBS 386.78]|nr:hypothetical protein QBC45DRAFT_410683 [Copromyces sp. CBS 386.78]